MFLGPVSKLDSWGQKLLAWQLHWLSQARSLSSGAGPAPLLVSVSQTKTMLREQVHLHVLDVAFWCGCFGLFFFYTHAQQLDGSVANWVVA